MVTPFRAKALNVRDEIVLTGSRAISDWSELYSGYTEYRLELLEERIRDMLKKERTRQATKRKFNITEMQQFLAEQKMLLEVTMRELIKVEDMD